MQYDTMTKINIDCKNAIGDNFALYHPDFCDSSLENVQRMTCYYENWLQIALEDVPSAAVEAMNGWSSAWNHVPLVLPPELIARSFLYEMAAALLIANFRCYAPSTNS